MKKKINFSNLRTNLLYDLTNYRYPLICRIWS